MINKKFLLSAFTLIVLIELLSLIVFWAPTFHWILFMAICTIFLFVSLKDLKLGALIIATELIIGSKGGYLFYLDIGEGILSIRIAFWLIFLATWFVKSLLPKILSKEYSKIFSLKYTWTKYFIIFGLFVAWGLVNGYLRNNSFDNLFFDFNSYLYFLLFLPFLDIITNQNLGKVKLFLNNLIGVISLSVVWISIKTLGLLFLFSHNIGSINSFIYSWVRTTSVGEITQIQGGFYRIFFQSHIFPLFALIAVFIFLVAYINYKKIRIRELLKDRNLVGLLLLASLFLTVTVVSMSRTNWVALVAILLLVLIYFFWKYRLRGILVFLSSFIIVSTFSFIALYTIVKFPYPKPIGGFETQEILTERASDIKNEAGVSSRWNLLPELFTAIKSNPIQGSGFGSTVTYISNDPRVRSTSVDGIYTTYAFEWGWLDIWLKLGLLGLISFIVFLTILLIDIFKKILITKKYLQDLYFVIFLTITALVVINFFSPYLNHPLGIGALIFTIIIYEGLLLVNKDKENKEVNCTLSN